MHIRKGFSFIILLSMTLENTVELQMGSFSFSVFFLRNPVPWMLAVLVPSFIFLSISVSGFFSFLAVSFLLIFSAIFLFKIKKQKKIFEEEESKVQFQVQPLCFDQSFDCKAEESENLANGHKTFQENGTDLVDDCLANGSPDSYTESEVADQYSSSEDSDIDWPFSGNVAGSPDFSDGSISDEESLIEIALPSGHYVGSKEEEDDKLRWGLQRKCQDFSPESIFGKRSLMELLAEINDMNEEDNLIEIDISVGSIKCSRFEIKA